jgi:hypothetical protein
MYLCVVEGGYNQIINSPNHHHFAKCASKEQKTPWIMISQYASLQEKKERKKETFLKIASPIT